MLQTERGGSQPPSRGRIDKLYYLLLQLPLLVASSSTTCCVNYPYLSQQLPLLDASTTPTCSNNYPYLFRLPLLVASRGLSSRQPWMKGIFTICLQLRFLGLLLDGASKSGPENRVEGTCVKRKDMISLCRFRRERSCDPTGNTADCPHDGARRPAEPQRKRSNLKGTTK